MEYSKKYKPIATINRKNLNDDFIYFWNELGCKGLCKSRLISITFIGTDEHYITFSSSLSKFQHLVGLDLNNSFFGDKAIQYISCMNSLKNLQYLNLSYTKLTDACAAKLCDIIPNFIHLQQLLLRQNLITNRGAVFIFDCLITCNFTNLWRFDISANFITDGVALSNLLKNNSSLVYVDMQHRQEKEITGLKKIIKVLEKNHTLTTLNLGKHKYENEMYKVLYSNRNNFVWKPKLTLSLFDKKFIDIIQTLLLLNNCSITLFYNLTENVLFRIFEYISLILKYFSLIRYY